MKINITVKNEANEIIKLLKIIPYQSGGFGLILPRLSGSYIGRLEKIFMTYEKYGTKLQAKRDESEQYSVNDIVKFSYHPDGFVQFSSATNIKIKSGRNPDGTPKGLGVISWPLSNPILTGPSMTISFWGLSGFTKDRSESVDNSYLFETREAIHHPKGNFKETNKTAYAMAFYILPTPIKGNVDVNNGRKNANLVLMQGLPNGKAFMRLREQVRIIEIPNQPFWIGISWFIIPSHFKTDSGYMFLGPTDGKRGLVASYPESADGQQSLMKDLSFK